MTVTDNTQRSASPSFDIGAWLNARGVYADASRKPFDKLRTSEVERLNAAFNVAFEKAAREGEFHRDIHRKVVSELYVTDGAVYKVIVGKNGLLRSFTFGSRHWYIQGLKTIDFAAAAMSAALDAGIEAARAEIRAMSKR